jgi:hypothetical protein
VEINNPDTLNCEEPDISILHNFNIKNTPNKFIASKICNFVSSLENISSEPWIINTVKGIEIPFLELQCQNVIPNPISFNSENCLIIQTEINVLLCKQVIEKVSDTQLSKYVSFYFKLVYKIYKRWNHSIDFKLKTIELHY